MQTKIEINAHIISLKSTLAVCLQLQILIRTESNQANKIRFQVQESYLRKIVSTVAMIRSDVIYSLITVLSIRLKTLLKTLRFNFALRIILICLMVYLSSQPLNQIKFKFDVLWWNLNWFVSWLNEPIRKVFLKMISREIQSSVR